MLDLALRRVRRIRSALAGMDGLRLMGDEVVRSGGAAQLDPLRLTVDVRGLGISGYQAGDWLRAACRVDVGSADQCHIGAQITHAADDDTERRFVEALQRLVADHERIERRPQADLPEPRALELDSVMLPREAFFGRVEQVPVDQAVGRTAAEMVSPYPPGVPVLVPGEVISDAALDYLTSGVEAGMLIPDAADPTMKSVRVVAEG